MNNFLLKVDSYKYWTNTLGVARAFLALCTLVNIVFNYNVFLKSKIDNFNIFYYLEGDIGKIFSILILLTVISGYFPRYTCIPHWWVAFSYFRGSFLVEGGDQLAAILTFLLIPIMLGDTRINHYTINEQKPKKYIFKAMAFYSYLLILIQVSFLYLQASVSKLSGEEWSNGTAVYYWLNDSLFGIEKHYFNKITFLFSNNKIMFLLNFMPLLIEFFLFLLIFVMDKKKVVKIGFILGIFLHLSFSLSFGLISFGFSMTGALILYIYAWRKDFNIEKLYFNMFKIKRLLKK